MAAPAARSLRQTLGRAVTTIQAAARGDFDARLVHIREGGPTGERLHAVNELIDRTDAFVREAAISMNDVSQGHYFRHIVERGMQGGFLDGARGINTATSAIAEIGRQVVQST
jgi:hypothetical protein